MFLASPRDVDAVRELNHEHLKCGCTLVADCKHTLAVLYMSTYPGRTHVSVSCLKAMATDSAILKLWTIDHPTTARKATKAKHPWPLRCGSTRSLPKPRNLGSICAIHHAGWASTAATGDRRKASTVILTGLSEECADLGFNILGSFEKSSPERNPNSRALIIRTPIHRRTPELRKVS